MDLHISEHFASRMRLRIPRRALPDGVPLGRGPDRSLARTQAVSRYVGSGQ